ncbi:MAG: hypothetical protein K0R92_749 [Lachnospiraceae bacterium]|jgi:hypothetical protein|nr:hypothetical protein [Lachnospiraceae bacterium]
MPSAYAHYRFGNEVYKLLPGKIQNTIDKYKDLYDIGLQGPDIFLFYKPMSPTPNSLLGYDIHDRPAKEFFQPAKHIVKQFVSPDAAMSYLFGFLCHFVFDSKCHPYVEEKIKQSGLSHIEIEVEYDRKLMLQDGHDPIIYQPVNYINNSSGNAAFISKFFPTVNKEQIEEALESMKRYSNLFVSPGILKRLFLYGILKITHRYEDFHGLIVKYKANPQCYDSCAKLDELYTEGIELSLELIKNYKEYVFYNEELSNLFDRTFGID